MKCSRQKRRPLRDVPSQKKKAFRERERESEILIAECMQDSLARLAKSVINPQLMLLSLLLLLLLVLFLISLPLAGSR